MKKLFLYLTSAFLFVVLTASISSAQSFSTGPAPGAPPSGNVSAQASCGTTTVTQSTSNTITALNSVACIGGSGHTNNSYYRAFVLEDFGITRDFDICEVLLGVQEATSVSGSQPMTVNLYTSDPEFPNGTLTLIGTTDTQVSDQALTIISIPVTGTVPAGSQLVVEIFTPDGQAVGNFFFIGSNADPETGPSYLEAAACGVASPTTTSALGYPNMHIVLDVVGDEVLPEIVVSSIPTLSEWGLIAMATVIGIAGFIVIRRKRVTA